MCEQIDWYDKRFEPSPEDLNPNPEVRLQAISIKKISWFFIGFFTKLLLLTRSDQFTKGL